MAQSPRGRYGRRYVVQLTSAERVDLQCLVSVGKAAARNSFHAHVLLQAEECPSGPGWPDTLFSQALSVHPNTIADP